MDHTLTLVLAYAVICALWWGVMCLVPLWRHPDRAIFARPWREVGMAFAAVIGVLVLGQLWGHGIRLRASGSWKPLAESINQLVIFSPIALLPIVRKQGFPSAWIQTRYLWARVGIGLALAMIALLAYSTLEAGALPFVEAVEAVFRLANAHLAVQVLLEDVAIAVLFVRVAAAVGPRWAVLLVAAVFAAGHIPAMIAAGASPGELLGLLRDFALGAMVMGTLWRGADIAWFWPVHFALDMTQFLKHAA